ncbi:hypothetical protein J1N35_037682, partial [Gossypium stocksii]
TLEWLSSLTLLQLSSLCLTFDCANQNALARNYFPYKADVVTQVLCYDISSSGCFQGYVVTSSGCVSTLKVVLAFFYSAPYVTASNVSCCNLATSIELPHLLMVFCMLTKLYNSMREKPMAPSMRVRRDSKHVNLYNAFMAYSV